jgi:hypothetical protein
VRRSPLKPFRFAILQEAQKQNVFQKVAAFVEKFKGVGGKV